MTQPQTNASRPLQGKFALVTGGSRGIGRGIVLKLAERGAAVAINYIKDEAAARDTLAKVRAHGAEGFVVRADVARPEEWASMAVQVREQFGALDIFVSNALGNLLGFMSPPMQVTMAQWDESFQCQSRAFFVGVREMASLLRERGRIVNLSYWPGSHLGGFLPYFAMGTNKAAQEAMCRYFALALAPRGITVNAVCAGITDDSIVNSLPKEAQEAMFAWLRSGWSPMGRPTLPADLGGAVAALCSEDAGWITGQTIVVDGGASLMSPEVPLDFQRP
ncbi:SDR family oxidoreductase [candidate division KSB1 bacterium]|nr:SDR family oxidoreductase [candidate division KSB1 bacterium]